MIELFGSHQQIRIRIMHAVSSVGRPPTPRASTVCSIVNDHFLLVFGGVGITSYHSDLFLLDLVKSGWSEIQPTTSPPTARGGACGGVIEDRALFVFGGRGDNGLLDESSLFDLETLEWTTVATTGSRPSAREDAAYGLLDSGVAIVCGNSEAGACSDVWVLNFRRASWTQAIQSGSVPIDGLSAAACAQIGQELLLFGGCDKNGRMRNELRSLDLQNFRWTEIELHGQIPRCRTHAIAVPINLSLLIVGGYGEAAALPDAWHVSLAGSGDTASAIDQSASLTITPNFARGAASGVMWGSRLFVFGGCTGDTFLNTVYAIEIPELLAETRKLQLSAPKTSQRLNSVTELPTKVSLLASPEGELDFALQELRTQVLGSSSEKVGSIIDENIRLRRENETLRVMVAELSQRLGQLERKSDEREYL